MELHPKSVIFTTIRLSTTQLVDFSRPWTSILLECRYDIPCNFSDGGRTKRHHILWQNDHWKEVMFGIYFSVYVAHASQFKFHAVNLALKAL